MNNEYNLSSTKEGKNFALNNLTYYRDQIYKIIQIFDFLS